MNSTSAGPDRSSVVTGRGARRALQAIPYGDVLALVVDGTGLVVSATGGFTPAPEPDGQSALLGRSLLTALAPAPEAVLAGGLVRSLIGDRVEAEIELAAIRCLLTFAPLDQGRRSLVTVRPYTGTEGPSSAPDGGTLPPRGMCDVARVLRWLSPQLQTLAGQHCRLSVRVQLAPLYTLAPEPTVARLFVSLVGMTRLLEVDVDEALLSVTRADDPRAGARGPGVLVQLQWRTSTAIPISAVTPTRLECGDLAYATGVSISLTVLPDGAMLTAFLVAPSPRDSAGTDAWQDAATVVPPQPGASGT